MRISDWSSDVCSSDLPVLGNVELKGRALILAVTSAERAKRGTALMTDALAGLVGSPLTTIETVEQAMAARAEGLTMSEPAPAIAPEVATPLIHAMLDRQYRATLDEPIGILGDITPRARSEEHTSELQSLMRISYAVFCLKKKNK